MRHATTTTPRHRVVKRPSHAPGLEEPSGGALAVGCWHTRQKIENFNNLLVFKITLDNIKKQIYIIRQ